MSRKTDEIYAFILAYKRAHDGNSPTVRVIGRNVKGLVSGKAMSTSVVHYHVDRLIRQGKLARNEHRQIEVVGDDRMPFVAHS